MADIAALAVHPVARLLLLAPFFVALLVVTVRSARHNGGVVRAQKPPVSVEREPSELGRLHQYIRWSMRSDLGRRDLVGRLHATTQKLYRGVPPTNEELKLDEEAFALFLDDSGKGSNSKSSRRTLSQLNAVIAEWESRIDRRPGGGKHG